MVVMKRDPENSTHHNQLQPVEGKNQNTLKQPKQITKQTLQHRHTNSAPHSLSIVQQNKTLCGSITGNKQLDEQTYKLTNYADRQTDGQGNDKGNQ